MSDGDVSRYQANWRDEVETVERSPAWKDAGTEAWAPAVRCGPLTSSGPPAHSARTGAPGARALRACLRAVSPDRSDVGPTDGPGFRHTCAIGRRCFSPWSTRTRRLALRSGSEPDEWAPVSTDRPIGTSSVRHHDRILGGAPTRPGVGSGGQRRASSRDSATLNEEYWNVVATLSFAFFTRHTARRPARPTVVRPAGRAFHRQV